jgi:TolB-like protein/DNA-binding winged helix-turn-helix (wHTH) protein/Tfp pilus assembly protein PilF
VAETEIFIGKDQPTAWYRAVALVNFHPFHPPQRMLQDQESVRFGLYTADLHAAELRKGHDHVPLQNLPFRILTVLLREPGRVVTREELRRELWPEDTFVDFERGISTAVSKLRDALGDTASNPRFIETVGRRGYRFIAPVTLLSPERPREFGVSNGTDEKTTSPAAPKVHETLPVPVSVQIANVKTGRRRIIYLLLVLAVVAALAAAWNALLRSSQAATHREIMSIAVLPLENLSGDPQQEYLSDGLTDAVTNLLAQIGNLRVISRTTAMHYKHSGKTAPEIAKQLGVDALIEGSVIRSGNHLRLTIQLVQASKDRDIWASSYEREMEDVLSLERELSREIAGQIRVQLTPEQEQRLAQKRTVDPESYTLYLQGRYYWHQRSEQSLIKAIAYFEQAVARDPNLAPAYAGLADTYVVLPFFSATPPPDGYQRARLAAEKALALDSGLAEAHNSVAYVRIYQDWNFAGAEEEFKKAIALNPNYATAHQWYAELLSIEGRNQEAIAEIHRALDLDPQSAIMHHQAGQILRSARQYPQALEEYHKSLELDPNLLANYFSMYITYRRTGDYKRAIEAAEIHSKIIGEPYRQGLLRAAQVFNSQGKEAFLQRSAKLWEKVPAPVASYYEVLDRAELRQWDQCLEILEREYRRHNPLVLNAKTDPELDGLRSDPRFQALLRKIGLP